MAAINRVRAGPGILLWHFPGLESPGKKAAGPGTFWKSVTLNLTLETSAFDRSSLRWPIHIVFLPTQIRFLIGGERVTCHWSKLNDTGERTKLTDSPGKQQLEL